MADTAANESDGGMRARNESDGSMKLRRTLTSRWAPEGSFNSGAEAHAEHAPVRPGRQSRRQSGRRMERASTFLEIKQQPSNSTLPTDLRPMATMRHAGLRRWLVDEVTPRLLDLRLPTLTVMGLVLTFATCFAFGGIFYMCGKDCFVLVHTDEFTYLEMVWLSVHTFTSVGFGSTYPTCHTAQALVLIEYYASLVVSSIVVAIFLFKFLKPHPLVRFSQDCLIIDNAFVDGEIYAPSAGPSRRLSTTEGHHLNLRIARESYYALTDCRVTVSCVLRKRHGKGGKVAQLKLRTSEMHRLELWDVWHHIDESSPLFQNLDMLKQVYVQLTVRDTVYNQEVHLSYEYGPSSLRVGKRFAEMISILDVERNCCWIDHTKMDDLEDMVTLVGCTDSVSRTVNRKEVKRSSMVLDGLMIDAAEVRNRTMAKARVPGQVAAQSVLPAATTEQSSDTATDTPESQQEDPVKRQQDPLSPVKV